VPEPSGKGEDLSGPELTKEPTAYYRGNEEQFMQATGEDGMHNSKVGGLEWVGELAWHSEVVLWRLQAPASCSQPDMSERPQQQALPPCPLWSGL